MEAVKDLLKNEILGGTMKEVEAMKETDILLQKAQEEAVQEHEL